MMDRIVRDRFHKLLDVNTPIIFIHNHDFARVDAFILSELGGEDNIVEWNPATGYTDFFNKEPMAPYEPLDEFLLNQYKPKYNQKVDKYLVLREIHDYLTDPRVKTLLELIAQRKLYDPDYSTTVICVSSIDNIPDEVKKYVSYLDFGYPSEIDIDDLITEHIETNGFASFKEEDRDVLKLNLKGMSMFDIDRVLDMAMSSNGSLSKDDTGMILEQKKAMVQKSGVVELIQTNEDLDSIGGLNELKKYLQNKSVIINNWPGAYKYGVSLPKGIFIVGMPGCGKSLCAKATAKAFEVPLIKMDMGSMMGKYVGQSEENLREAIRIAEAAAPCVLWIDEIEKAFSGVGGNNDILSRMFGYFLSWLQDKKSSVYVIATANNADNLPPELKRKGRFDEIFCVNLPDLEERKAIFKVHLKKLIGKDCLEGKDIESFDYNGLAKSTEGFNGADIEAVVTDAVERCFLSRDTDSVLSDKILLETAKNTLSISKSCKEQIMNMKKVFSSSSFRDATSGKLSGSPSNPQ